MWKIVLKIWFGLTGVAYLVVKSTTVCVFTQKINSRCCKITLVFLNKLNYIFQNALSNCKLKHTIKN
jgi:hypothetical protein